MIEYLKEKVMIYIWQYLFHIQKQYFGGDIEVPLVTGEKERYKIKEGTKNGSKYKIKGKGFKHPNSNIEGDLYFIVEIDVPTKLTKNQRELLEELAKTMGEDIPPKKKNFFESIFDN